MDVNLGVLALSSSWCLQCFPGKVGQINQSQYSHLSWLSCRGYLNMVSTRIPKSAAGSCKLKYTEATQKATLWYFFLKAYSVLGWDHPCKSSQDSAAHFRSLQFIQTGSNSMAHASGQNWSNPWITLTNAIIFERQHLEALQYSIMFNLDPLSLFWVSWTQNCLSDVEDPDGFFRSYSDVCHGIHKGIEMLCFLWIWWELSA